jgi:hypothetical protein
VAPAQFLAERPAGIPRKIALPRAAKAELEATRQRIVVHRFKSRSAARSDVVGHVQPHRDPIRLAVLQACAQWDAKHRLAAADANPQTFAVLPGFASPASGGDGAVCALSPPN